MVASWSPGESDGPSSGQSNKKSEQTSVNSIDQEHAPPGIGRCMGGLCQTQAQEKEGTLMTSLVDRLGL